MLRDFGGRRARDRATRFAPTQGQGKEWAQLNTRLPPLVAASFSTWPQGCTSPAILRGT